MELYKFSKAGLALKNSTRTVNKPCFIFVIKMCSDLNEISKNFPKLEQALKALPWDDFVSKELAPELEKLKVTDTPRKNSFTASLKERKEEQKSCYDLLFEKLTSYDYSDLVDQPVEDVLLVSAVEKRK